MQKHIKTMYTELLSEADATKELEKHLETLDSEIKGQVTDLEVKKTLSTKTKRQFDVLEHVRVISSRI